MWSVKIPNSLKTIRYTAFKDNQLTSVTLGNCVTTIGWSAFYGNQLTSLEIPNSVTTIEGSVFERNQLRSVTMGNGITSIGDSAFYKVGSSNPNLTSITIDKSCNDIKNNLVVIIIHGYPALAHIQQKE